MKSEYESTVCSLAEDNPLRILLEGTATVTGERFFDALVENLAKALGTNCAWITEHLKGLRRLRTLAFWKDGRLHPSFDVDIEGSPCEAVIERAEFVHYPDNILELFPQSSKLKEFGAVSYMGVPLQDLDRTVLGHLAVIDNRPLAKKPDDMVLFQLFAARAAAELQRIRAEAEVRERREKLSRLVDTAMDAIIELDDTLNIVHLNPAAKAVFSLGSEDGVQRNFLEFLKDESHKKICDLIKELDTRPADRKHLWVSGGLQAVNTRGEQFAAEASLSRFEMERRDFYTLILRNVNDRIEAERKIRALTEEAEYLKEEIRALDNFGEIIGESFALKDVLRHVQQVAVTDSTVLIQGETGTGKELIARAVHQASSRARKPFIKLNCAALPTNLVESELFGHEAGSFTGADRQRKGRFELADGGSILLDEISEMPMEVQARLLHVLQEGHFERVGGSRTLKADVRVIAATNRNLTKEIVGGRFRADLFYRLNVYPITIPPLRERREDIPVLVNYFVRQISSRLRKTITDIPASTMHQLIAYEWPGNVRELKNVIERAIITSAGPVLHLPEALEHISSKPAAEVVSDFASLDTVARQHIVDVLQATGWRISGPEGAAKILGINPSTLRFRIKKLGITTPWKAR